MIKKFVTNALLSIVMDKKARDSLNNGNKPAPAKQPEKSLLADDAATAPPASAPKTQQPAARQNNETMTAEDTHALIRQTLEAAEQEMEARKNMPPERRALIENALNLRRSKEHMLDELSDEQREKLFVIAMKTMDPDFDPGNKK